MAAWHETDVHHEGPEEPDDAPELQGDELDCHHEEHPPDYAVLIDTGADWPDVIFVGGFERAHAVLARVPEQHRGSVQAVVSLDDALAYEDGRV